MQTRTIQILCLVIASVSLGDAVIAEQPRFALLVGVSEYANLSASEQLSGVKNDVRLMKQVLKELYGFKEEEICVLTGTEATGDAIRHVRQE